MRSTLDEDPESIRDVYLEALKLESYGAALIREIQDSRSKSSDGNKLVEAQPGTRHRSVSSNNNRSKSNKYEGKMSVSDAYYSRTLEEVQSHLKTVAELSRDVMARVWDNIERIWDLAAENQCIVVATFEVIEMHKQLQRRRRKMKMQNRIQSSNKEEGDTIDGKVNANPTHMRPQLATQTFATSFTSTPLLSCPLSDEIARACPLHVDSDIRFEAERRLQQILDQKIEASFVVNLEAHLGSCGQDPEADGNIAERVTATVTALTQVEVAVLYTLNA